MVDAKDKVQVEARAKRNQLIMFSTIIAFIDPIDILLCRPAAGNIQKAIDPFGVNRLTNCLDSSVLGLSNIEQLVAMSLGKAAYLPRGQSCPNPCISVTRWIVVDRLILLDATGSYLTETEK